MDKKVEETILQDSQKSKKKNTPAEIKCTKPEENSQLFCLIAWCLMVNLQAVLAGVSDAVCVYVCLKLSGQWGVTGACSLTMQQQRLRHQSHLPLRHTYTNAQQHINTHIFFFFKKHRFWPLKCLVVGSKHSFGSDEELRCVLHNGDIFICARHPVDVFHDSI